MRKIAGTIIIFLLLATSLISIFFFIIKWMDTDMDTAWKAFEDHVNNCLGDLF